MLTSTDAGASWSEVSCLTIPCHTCIEVCVCACACVCASLSLSLSLCLSVFLRSILCVYSKSALTCDPRIRTRTHTHARARFASPVAHVQHNAWVMALLLLGFCHRENNCQWTFQHHLRLRRLRLGTASPSAPPCAPAGAPKPAGWWSRWSAPTRQDLMDTATKVFAWDALRVRALSCLFS